MRLIEVDGKRVLTRRYGGVRGGGGGGGGRRGHELQGRQDVSNKFD